MSTRIENFEIHPQYDNASLVKDVCVIKTKTDLQLDGKARNTVCLPDNKQHLLTDSSSDSGEKKCFIAGWGRQENEKSSGVLNSAKGRVEIKFGYNLFFYYFCKKLHFFLIKMICSEFFKCKTSKNIESSRMH